MATTMTWDLSLTEVEIGKEVTLTAEGLAAHEGVAVVIQRPDGSVFIWGVTSDANGRISDTIKLDSGLGQYVFCPKPACGYVVPRCRHLNVCPCNTARTDCAVKIEGPARIMAGHEVTWEVTGLTPSKLISVKLATNTGVSSFIEGISDTQGRYRYTTTINLADTYALTVSDGSCTSAPYIIEVISSTLDDPFLPPIVHGACDKTVDIRTSFNKVRYEYSEDGNLRVVVCNKSPYTRVIHLTQILGLPGAIISSNNIPDVVTLAGLDCKEYLVLFRVGASDVSLSATIAGAYDCNDALFSATGGTAHAVVGAGQGICNAILQFFGDSVNPTTNYTSSPIELSVQIFNAGNQPITITEVPSFALPANVTFNTTMPVSVGPVAVAATATLTFKLDISAPGSYTIYIPPGTIKYTCGGSMLTIDSPAFFSFNYNP